MGKTLEELVLSRTSKGMPLRKVVNEVYREYVSGKLDLTDLSPPKTILNYLIRLDYSLWFWTIITLTTLTNILTYITNYIPQLIPLRWVLGTLYVLFMPGYVLVEALYPTRGGLSPLERVALAVGLSLAITPLLGLILNYTPWGIRLTPILITISTYVIVISLLAAFRKLRKTTLPPNIGE